MLATMSAEIELHEFGAGLFVWQRYDATVKAELFSTALRTADGTYLIDPILLPDAMLAAALTGHSVAGVIVTNANHARAAGPFSAKYSVPIFAHAAVRPELAGARLTEVAEGGTQLDGLQIVELNGAAPGEIALVDHGDPGTVVIGDALINFGSNGFSLLPAKYCENAKLLRSSLRKLLAFQFERMFFAHGTPILSGARARLAGLLDEKQ